MATRDPRKVHPQPPYSSPKQKPPGTEKQLQPAADHGEKSYVGHGVLKDRKALITGADSGIGRAVALAFAREGADVAISYLSEDADAEETKRLVEAEGRKAVLLRGDLATRKSCEKVAAKAVSQLGGMDILVNNAAYQRTYDKLEDVPDEEFVECYAVNLFAIFRLSQVLLPKIPSGGSIINTASIQSYDPTPNLIAYASTKAAVVSLTRSLSAFAMAKGVRVNAVAPGPVHTPLIPATLPKEKVREFGKDNIFGRAAQPAEMAPIFVFLASDQASYVSGEVYGATGGRMPL